MGFVYRKYAPTETRVTEGRRFAPMAPGALRTPHAPGEVPDISDIPGHHELPIPLPVDGPRRPLGEYGTSQRIMHVYDRVADPLDESRWTMALPSDQEQRKADSSRRQLTRPQAGFLLGAGAGSSLSKQMLALEAQAEAERAALEAQAAAPAEGAPKQ